MTLWEAFYRETVVRASISLCLYQLTDSAAPAEMIMGSITVT